MTVTITGELPQGIYDVAVIGAGVVGTAIARELARYPLRWWWPGTTNSPRWQRWSIRPNGMDTTSYG